jgi:hypothetical protein
MINLTKFVIILAVVALTNIAAVVALTNIAAISVPTLSAQNMTSGGNMTGGDNMTEDLNQTGSISGKYILGSDRDRGLRIPEGSP